MSDEQGSLFPAETGGGSDEQGSDAAVHFHCLALGTPYRFAGCTHVVAAEAKGHHRRDDVSVFFYRCPDWVVPPRWGCSSGDGLWLA